MARLPDALREKERVWTKAQQLRQENIDRLKAGQAPLPTPDPVAPTVVRADPSDPASLTVVDREPVAAATTAVDDTVLEVEPGTGVEEFELPPEPAAPAPEQDEENRRLRDRLSTVEGMLRKTGEEKSAAEVRAQQEAERRAAVERELEETRSRQPRAPLTKEELLRYYSEEFIEEEGIDKCRALVQAQLRAAEETSRAAVAASRKQLDDERERLRKEREEEAAASATRSRQQFEATLTAVVPTWREVNQSAAWKQWLGIPNPGDDAIRQVRLSAAVQANDADRVAAMLKAFMQTQPKRPAVRPVPENRQLPPSRPAAPQRTESVAAAPVTTTMIADHNKRYGRDRRYRESPEAKAMQQKIDGAMRDRSVIRG